MTIYHKHHIIPRHKGGTDNPENLLLVTVEEHTNIHKTLWEIEGRWQDYIAWKALSGQITKEEARRMAVSHALRGKKQSPEHLANRSNKGKKYKPASEERKQKMREIMKGRKPSENAIKASRETRGKRIVSEKTREKQSNSAKLGWIKRKQKLFINSSSV